ncbi:MAG TPA: ABC transporter permease [Bryobacteraceae bacterium]
MKWLGHFVRDIRFSFRGLAKNPGFGALAVISLALGIGGSTAMYSVIYAVILHPFAYKDVDRLVSVQLQDSQGRSNGSYYTIDPFLDIAERNTVFSGVIASTWSDVTLTSEGDPLRLRGNHCTMNTFDVMGVPPLVGRTTTAEDAKPGAPPVAVLGYKFWQRQYGSSNSVIGRKLTLNGKVRTVIGVMPPRFMWRGADVYLPDVFHRGQDVEGENEVHLLARLKPGVNEAQAVTDLQPVFEDLRRRNPTNFPEKWHIRLLTFKETFPSDITEALWILFGAVGLLLLISCANVSSLLLSRLAARQREIAIRSAVGASRPRLIGQLLSETLLLALCGGALGVAAAYGALHGIIAMVPPFTIPDEAEIRLNAPVLLFTLGVSVMTALLAGLAPALQFSGRDIMASLKEAGRSLVGGTGQRMLRNAMVVGEVALSLMLLVGASLMIRTLMSIQSADTGMHRESILTMRIPFSQDRYPTPERRVAFLQNALTRIASVPGVTAAGINAGMAPVYNWTVPVELPGRPPDNRPVVMEQVNEGYGKALGLSLVRGRFLSAEDVGAKLHRAAVNQAFARRYFEGRDALGSVFRVPLLKSKRFKLADDSFEIVGVVRDTVNRISTQETLPEIYIPYTLTGIADRLYLLASVPPETLDRAVRDQIYATDRGQPVTDVRTMENMLSDFVYARPRFNLLLFSVFAGLGLVLALLGVHGVMSNAVAQRTREIGIRFALGAGYGQVIGMVLRSATRLLGIGAALGIIGSLASARVLRGLVRNVSTIDPYSMAAVIGLLFATGLFASYWPARKAGRVDPIRALREE